MRTLPAYPARFVVPLGMVLLIAPGCDRDESITELSSGSPALSTAAAPPAGVVLIPVDNGSLSLWPYTGSDFTGTPQGPSDRVEIAFQRHFVSPP